MTNDEKKYCTDKHKLRYWDRKFIDKNILSKVSWDLTYGCESMPQTRSHSEELLVLLKTVTEQNGFSSEV